MRTRLFTGVIAGIALCGGVWNRPADALGTAFTYQGQMQQGGSPRN